MYGEPVDYDYSPEVKVNSQQIFDRFKTHLHRTKKEAKAKISFDICHFTARKRSCGKVMFLHLSVSNSVHRVVTPP